MRCFTVMGPSQSGKSTLVQQLAQLDGPPPKTETCGQISVTRFEFIDEPWCAIDYAGGPEFAGQVGPALLASDAAVLCTPADPESAVLAAPYLRAIEASGTPCLIFINRVDLAKGRVRDIVAALQAYSNHAIVLRQVPMRDGGQIVGAVDLISERAWKYREGQVSSLVEIPEDLHDREQEARTEVLEHLSDFDDDLLEQLIEDKEPAVGTVFDITSRVLAENKVVPAFLGAASHNNGIMRLMKSLRHEAPQVDVLRDRIAGGEPAIASGFHAEMRKHVGKSVFLRALDDGVAAGANLGGGNVGSLTAIGDTAAVDKLAAGDVGIAVKSDHLNTGSIYTAEDAVPAPDWVTGHVPAFQRIIAPESEKDDVRLSGAIARLLETDIGIRLGHDERTGQAVVSVQGPMHLRAVMRSLSEDFGVPVTDGEPSASYRETISRRVEEHYRHRKQSGGAGQFADVQMVIEPQSRGGGFTFEEVVKGGAVPRNYIPSVEHGANDALQEGPHGFPVIDVKVTLTDGKHHSVDSSDFAFRTAGRMGVKEAIRSAGPVLLQPIDAIRIFVPSVSSGAMVSLVSSLKGQVLGFDRDPDAEGWDIFRALLPASAKDELLRALGAATQGTAWFESEFDHYEEVYGKEAEKISKEQAEAMA